MNEITNREVERYVYDLLPRRDAVLRRMETEATKRSIPIIGPAVARVIYLLATGIGAKRVFEMGSAIGYSTLWLARAVGEQGEVFYTDGNPKNAREAEGYFKRAGVSKRIHVMVGNALDLIQQVKGNFDIIFNDVDKHWYPDVFGLAVPRVRKGGLFITDNVLWDGRVARSRPDLTTRKIQEFNHLIYSSNRLFSTILPIRDGVAVCRKL
ncbi:MAG: O-methyltransferase [Acidobacteriia bacterium]|nr:O-methyltransferase [Terriglobia bacterium]